MLKLDNKVRDQIVKAIAESVIPTNIGVQIINVLNSLEEIKEEKAKSEK